MMDLPLMMAAPPAARGGGHATGAGQGAGSGSDDGGFEAALTALLGDAGKEVVEMVEALEMLTDLNQDPDELAALGWPLPALLALSGQVEESGDEVASDTTADELDLELLADLLVDEGDGEVASERSELLGGQLDSEGVDGPVTTASGEGTEDEEGDQGDAASVDVDDTATDEGEVAAAPVTPPVAPATGEDVEVEVDAAEVDTIARAARSRVAAPTTDEDGAAATDIRARAASGERAGTVRTEGSVDRVPSGDGSVDLPLRNEVARQANTRAPVLSPAILRVMEAVERLETMPPPRQLTVDLGEVRVRVAMDDGQVRLSILEGDQEAGDDLLQDARDELAQRGFDLSGDGEEEAGYGPDARDDRPRTRTAPSRPSRREPAGLRL